MTLILNWDKGHLNLKIMFIITHVKSYVSCLKHSFHFSKVLASNFNNFEIEVDYFFMDN